MAKCKNLREFTSPAEKNAFLVYMRVTKATREDSSKLSRVLGYLCKMRGEILQLQPKGILQVEAYVDASFAPYSDSKSHTGIAVFIGSAMVFAASQNRNVSQNHPWRVS